MPPQPAQGRAVLWPAAARRSLQACPFGGCEPHYAREFELIASGAKAHFNFAAFFLGFYRTLYRGCAKRFLALYAWPWALTLV